MMLVQTVYEPNVMRKWRGSMVYQRYFTGDNRVKSRVMAGRELV
jgi:hypothetical protein